MITVVIPTYNRAHLLPKIVPTYLQNGVTKIIIVDDASTDNTREVVRELVKEIPIIQYFRQKVNSKQAAAKNVGIDNTDTEWIYFGDDDSILMPNSINILFETCIKYNAEICGAKALYMQTEEDEKDPLTYVEKMDLPLPKNKKIADLDILKGNFIYSFNEPIEVPYVHASALVKTSIAKKIKFDPEYIGNCYREETDFFLRANLAGAKIMYNSKAVQVNLPRKISTGGAHSSNKLKWYYYTLINNHRFITKIWEAVRKKYKNAAPGIIVEVRFISKMLRAGFRNFIVNKLLKH